VRFANRTET